MNVTVKTDEDEVQVATTNTTIKSDDDGMEIDFEAVALNQSIETESTSGLILQKEDDEYVFESSFKSQVGKTEHVVHISPEAVFMCKRLERDTENNKRIPKDNEALVRLMAELEGEEKAGTESSEECEKRSEEMRLIKMSEKLRRIIKRRNVDAEGKRIVTSEEREIRRALNAERVRRCRARETPEQREKRLLYCAERYRRIKAGETPEQRKKRLSSAAERKKNRVARETGEERLKRLSSEAEKHRKLRVRETPEQREKRRLCDAERKKKTRGMPQTSFLAEALTKTGIKRIYVTKS